MRQVYEVLAISAIQWMAGILPDRRRCPARCASGGESGGGEASGELSGLSRRVRKGKITTAQHSTAQRPALRHTTACDPPKSNDKSYSTSKCCISDLPYPASAFSSAFQGPHISPVSTFLFQVLLFRRQLSLLASRSGETDRRTRLSGCSGETRDGQTNKARTISPSVAQSSAAALRRRPSTIVETRRPVSKNLGYWKHLATPDNTAFSCNQCQRIG